MRFLAAFLALALSACSTIPVDPNYTAALQSAQAQQTAIAQANAQAAQARLEAAAACAKADSDIKAAVCALGLAAADRGSSSAPAAVALPTYQRPESVGEQWGRALTGAANLAGPIGQAIVGVKTATENGKTTRELAHVNADRETANFATLAGFGAAVSHDNAATAQVQAANQVPTYQLGPGASIAGGDITQAGRDLNSGTQTTVGGDQTGGDHVDRHDVTTTCIAGNGGSGGATGDPNAGGASGVGGAGAAGGSACH